MEATGVYWKPVWHILSDGEIELVLANAAHVKEEAGMIHRCGEGDFEPIGAIAKDAAQACKGIIPAVHCGSLQF